MDCGQRIPRCPTCGTVLQQRAKFCMVDGTRIPDEIIALIPEQEAEAAKVFMPGCVGLHFDEVTKTFESIPCQLTFSYAYSDTVAENYIIEQMPAEGTELTAETEVNITVSKGLDAAPEGYNQKVTVTAAPDSSYGTLTLYDWEKGQWVSKFTCDATLGKKGISPDYGEGKKRTDPLFLLPGEYLGRTNGVELSRARRLQWCVR